MKQNDLFFTIKRNNISEDTITVLVHDVRSFSKHIDDIVSDNRIINNDTIRFTETQINPSDSTSNIMKILKFFNINFKSNISKFLNLAYGCRNNVAILNKFDANGVSTFNSDKTCFCRQVIHFNVSL